MKAKIISIILFLIILGSIAATAISLISSFKVTDQIVQTQFEEKLEAAYKMLVLRINDINGELRISERGELINREGKSIHGDYKMIDQLAENMDVIVTVFVKQNDDYVSVMSNLKLDNGARAVGDDAGQDFRGI